MISAEHLPALAVAAPLAGALSAPLIAWTRPRWTRAWALAACAASLAAAAGALGRAAAGGPWRYAFGGWPAPWGIEYAADVLSCALAALLSGLACLTLAYGWGWEREREELGEGVFQALTLLLLTGLLGITLTGDLFNLYVFLEIASLSGYALVAAGDGPRASVAAFRYLILGSAGATFWVLGLGYLYALTGTLNMRHLAALWPEVSGSPAAKAALALMTAGLALKIPIFPLHGWQPDAYAAAPPRVMPFIAAAASTAMVFAVLRLLHFTLGGVGAAAWMLGILAPAAMITIAAGSILALTQTDLRRVLAYSSVSQLGHVLLGFSIGGRTALTGALLYAFAHALLKGGLFMVVGAVARGRGSCSREDLRGLARAEPLLAAAFAVAALGLVGLPPLASFFGKWYLLQGAVAAGRWTAAGVLAASGLLTALYVFPMLEAAFLETPPEGARWKPLPAAGTAAAVVLAAGAVLLGVFNEPLAAAAAPALDSWLAGGAP